MSSKFVALLAGLMMAGSAHAQVVQPSPVVPPVTPQNVLVLNLSVGGPIRIQLRPDMAPESVVRIKTLVRRHFYDGLAFHRVIEGFMAQGGDPKGTGEGGSDLPDLKAEFNDLPHVRGVVSLARTNEPNTANSQFFIMLQPNLGLDHNYTAIGRVIEGMQYADAIEKGEPPVNPTKIVHASIESDDLGQPAETPESIAASKPPEVVARVLTKQERKEMARNIEANKTSDAVAKMSTPGGQQQ